MGGWSGLEQNQLEHIQCKSSAIEAAMERAP